MNPGRIHSIETMGTLDGPGIRTVFFMQGCNMQCLYCHNRDSWDLSSGKAISKEEIVETVSSYRAYYGGNGGVTFSGGEPLLQSSFLLDVVIELKKRGIHTALDTSGSVYSRESRELLGAVDLVILDIKNSDDKVFRELCGLSSRNMKANLVYLQEGKTPYWIRQVILEGYTDSQKQMDDLSRMLKRGKPPLKIELLPYHGMGMEKWDAAGQHYGLKGAVPPDRELMNQLNMRLRNSLIE